MSIQVVLVDGYSVLHAWPKLRKLAGRSLVQQRDALVRVLRQYGDHTGRRIVVVFDGYAAKRKPDINEPTPGVEVIYSEHGKTADDVIERLVAQAGDKECVLVVTSDNMERHTVESLGANSMAADFFEEEVTATLRDLASLVHRHSRPRRIGSVKHGLDG